MIFFSKNTNGFYDSEIHQEYPSDAVEIQKDRWTALLSAQSQGKIIAGDENGYPIAVDLSESGCDMTVVVISTIQQRLDAFAASRGYDGIMSACTYATSTSSKFRAEGTYCVQARDDHWAMAYSILADVENGNRATPTVADVLAEMPALAWPDVP